MIGARVSLLVGAGHGVRGGWPANSVTTGIGVPIIYVQTYIGGNGMVPLNSN